MIQILTNGIIEGFSLAVLAIGFGIIYNTLKVFHFAYGALYVLAAYMFYAGLGWGGLVVAIIVSLIIECFVYNPLYKKNAPLAVTFISSLGIYIIIINVIALLFGNEIKILNPEIQTTYEIGSVILTEIQLLILIASIISIVILLIIIEKTKLGNTLVAVGENLTLAKVIGIKVNLFRMLAIATGTLLASIIAILKGLDVGIDPYIGMGAVLGAAVAYIISGGINYYTMILAGIILGLIRNLTVWYFSAQWMEASTFILLIIILLVKKRGLTNQLIRIEES